MKQVAIVILNYNGKKYLEKFLPSVYNTTYENYVLYVADNASTDDSVQFLEQNAFVPFSKKTKPQHGERIYIKLDKNYGFAQGYNEALKDIEADYYMLLNSDVEVSPDWLQPLVNALDKNNNIASVQPKILMESEKTLFEHAGGSGGWIDKYAYPFCRGRVFDHLETDNGQYNDEAEIFWSSGAAMLIRSELYHLMNGFDGDFFAHMEEIDLCWRLKRLGYQIFCIPSSTVWHVGGGTLPKSNPHKTYLNFRNNLCMIAKNMDAMAAIWVIFVKLCLDGVAGVRFLFKGEFGNLFAIVKAHFAFYARLPKMIGKRALPERIDKEKRPFNRTGVLNKSLVFQAFINKKHTYKNLI